MPESQNQSADPGAASQPGTPQPKSLIDSAAELADSAVTYARQEVGDLVHDKVALPIQKAGATFGLALVVAVLIMVGVMFIAVGALILLAHWITWPGALFLVGGVLIVASAIVAMIRLRSVQK